jgi:hypothetical protein
VENAENIVGSLYARSNLSLATQLIGSRVSPNGFGGGILDGMMVLLPIARDWVNIGICLPLLDDAVVVDNGVVDQIVITELLYKISLVDSLMSGLSVRRLRRRTTVCAKGVTLGVDEWATLGCTSGLWTCLLMDWEHCTGVCANIVVMVLIACTWSSMYIANIVTGTGCANASVSSSTAMIARSLEDMVVIFTE